LDSPSPQELKQHFEAEDLKKVQETLDDLKQTSNAYPEDFIRALQADNPDLYKMLKESMEGNYGDVDQLLKQVDDNLVRWSERNSSVPKVNVDTTNESELTDLQRVQKKLNERANQINAYPKEFVQHLKETKPLLFSTLVASEDPGTPTFALARIELAEWTAEKATEEDIQSVQVKLNNEKPNTYSKDFIRYLIKNDARVYVQLVEHANNKDPKALKSFMEGTLEQQLLLWAASQKENPAPTPEAIREKVKANRTEYKKTSSKTDTEEKFTVNLVNKAEENATRIQDLVEDPAALPLAKSSRYPGVEFHYDAAKDSYFAEDQRLLIYNGDLITVYKATIEAPVVEAAAEPAVAEAEPIEAPVPAEEPVQEVAPAKATPEPIAAPAPEMVEPEKTTKTKRKDRINVLKQEQRAQNEAFAEENNLEYSVVAKGTDREEYEFHLKETPEVRKSIHLNFFKSEGVPAGINNADASIIVGDPVFGKEVNSM
ncbi:MAG: hypothetical protein AAB802_02495, partial [Patescibacteria group bacterium]